MTSDTNIQTSVRRARRSPTARPQPSAPSATEIVISAASTTGTVQGAHKPGSKNALLLDLLKDGATVPVLSDRLGWLPYTVRAALSGLRKRGIEVVKNRDPDGVTAYSIQPVA